MEQKKVEFVIEKTEKGIETFEVPMDGVELVETGRKEINGKMVEYYKFKIIKKK